MNLVQFHRLRTAVQVSAPPGAGADLVAVETDLRDALLDSGLFVTVEVGRTEDPDALVIALCTYDPFYSEGDAPPGWRSSGPSGSATRSGRPTVCWPSRTTSSWRPPPASVRRATTSPCTSSSSAAGPGAAAALGLRAARR